MGLFCQSNVRLARGVKLTAKSPTQKSVGLSVPVPREVSGTLGGVASWAVPLPQRTARHLITSVAPCIRSSSHTGNGGKTSKQLPSCQFLDGLSRHPPALVRAHFSLSIRSPLSIVGQTGPKSLFETAFS